VIPEAGDCRGNPRVLGHHDPILGLGDRGDLYVGGAVAIRRVRRVDRIVTTDVASSESPPM